MLQIPEKCGYPLSYGVREFKHFPSESQPETDEEAMQTAVLSGYLDVLLYGLRGTKEVLTKMEYERLQSTCLCGRKLFFGSYELKNCSYVYTTSPIPGAYMGKDFVNLRELRGATKNDENIIWFNESDEGNMSVVVKCSSRSFHQWLVDPSHTRMALIDVIRLSTLPLPLSNVLLGVYFSDGGGLVVLMKNLTAHYYSALKANGTVSIDQLWNSFFNLVKSTLIPLAEHKIVHADIRPGYDYSANLLYDAKTGDMQLIDFESLVKAYALAEDPCGSKDANKYVWWQCLRVAFAWITQTNLSDMPLESHWKIDISRDQFEEGSVLKSALGDDWGNIIRLASRKSLAVQELDDSLEQIKKAVLKTRGTAQQSTMT